jgi:2-C-methyl-D-erythritol 4-phosphate cytidylyltransferase
MKVSAIIPSAGSGSRMRSKIDKPFIKLRQKELIYYPLRVLQDSSLISDIIVVTRPRNIDQLKALIRREGLSKVRKVVIGARRRAESVYKGLLEISDDTDYVLVHDAARPFITKDIIRRNIEAAKAYGACLTAVLVKPTIKEADKNNFFVKRTLDRKHIWEAQTPQTFKKDILIAAYRQAGTSAALFTDEASLVERTGCAVKIVEGSDDNIKITTPKDLKTAEVIIGHAHRDRLRSA